MIVLGTEERNPDIHLQLCATSICSAYIQHKFHLFVYLLFVWTGVNSTSNILKVKLIIGAPSSEVLLLVLVIV